MDVSSVVQEIQKRVDIVNLIELRSGTRLKKSGNTFVGNCPWHQDSTPSFTVYPETNSFHCFSCKKSGDALKFVQLYEHKGFWEAVESLGGQKPQHLKLDADAIVKKWERSKSPVSRLMGRTTRDRMLKWLQHYNRCMKPLRDQIKDQYWPQEKEEQLSQATEENVFEILGDGFQVWLDFEREWEIKGEELSEASSSLQASSKWEEALYSLETFQVEFRQWLNRWGYNQEQANLRREELVRQEFSGVK